MAIKTERKIDVKGFEHLVFTEDYYRPQRRHSWNIRDDYPKAVEFCRERGAILQSATEAAAFSTAGGGIKDEATRTAAVYFKDGSQFFLALDDIPCQQENIILSRTQEGAYAVLPSYCEHMLVHQWILPRNDRHIKSLLQRAEKAGRVIPITVEEDMSKLRSDVVVRPIFGDLWEDLARVTYNETLNNEIGKYREEGGYAIVKLHGEEELDGMRFSEVNLEKMGIGEEHIPIIVKVSTSYSRINYEKRDNEIVLDQSNVLVRPVIMKLDRSSYARKTLFTIEMRIPLGETPFDGFHGRGIYT